MQRISRVGIASLRSQLVSSSSSSSSLILQNSSRLRPQFAATFNLVNGNHHNNNISRFFSSSPAAAATTATETTSNQTPAAAAAPSARFWQPEKTDILRFSSRQYLFPGGLNRSGSVKVELKFWLKDLGLTEKQNEFFIALIDNRYNQETGEVTLTCEDFPQRSENKHRLLVILKELLIEAKKIA